MEGKILPDKRFCLQCGKEIVSKDQRQKFCSRSCAATYNNKRRNKKIREEISKSLHNYHAGVVKNESKRYCECCGKELTDNHQKKYCSSKCARVHTHNEYISRWKSGNENGMSGEYQLSNHIKRYFMEKYNCKCQLCGWGERNLSTNTIPLEIHHIDGDYTNNKEENLQLLCPNCHSLTDTYKSHNKSGRKERNKYK